MRKAACLLTIVACLFGTAATAHAGLVAARTSERWSQPHRRVAMPPLPIPMPQIINAPCPGLEGEVAGCEIGVGEADQHGTVYPTGAVFTTGDRFTTAHELGHAFDETLMDAAERERFSEMVWREDEVWSDTYTTDAGALVQSPDSLAEVFADAYANCRLNHVVGPGHLWEAGYDYYPTPRQHRRVCRAMVRWGRDAGQRMSANGVR